MTRSFLLLASTIVSTALLAGSAAAQDTQQPIPSTGGASGTSTEGSGNDGGTNAGIGAPANSGTASTTGPLSAQTKDYVLHSEMSDKFEIASSKLALTRSQDPKVKDFAKHMISDHGLSTSKLHKLTLKDRMDVATSPKLDAEHTQLLTKLKSEKGKTFDQTYLQAQSDGHQDALTLQQTYASAGDNADLKSFAGSMVPVIQGHIQMLKGISGGTSSGTP